MHRLSRLLLLLLLVALPLRGLAVDWAGACEAQDRGIAHALHDGCDESPHAGHGEVPDGDGSAGNHGSCSHCAACAASAPMLSDSGRQVSIGPGQGSSILFLARQVPSGIPERLERPPLSL